MPSKGICFWMRSPDLAGEQIRYVLAGDGGNAATPDRESRPAHTSKILMEYSPGNAIPFVSRVDAGIMEVVLRVPAPRFGAVPTLRRSALAV